MPINAEEIEDLESKVELIIKEYLQNCILDLRVESSYEGPNALELTVSIEAPRPYYSSYREILMEYSVTFDVGEENERD